MNVVQKQQVDQFKQSMHENAQVQINNNKWDLQRAPLDAQCLTCFFTFLFRE